MLDAADWVPLLTDATLRAALDADPALLAMVPFAADVGRFHELRKKRGDAPTPPPAAASSADALELDDDDDGLGDAFDDAEFEGALASDAEEDGGGGAPKRRRIAVDESDED